MSAAEHRRWCIVPAVEVPTDDPDAPGGVVKKPMFHDKPEFDARTETEIGKSDLERYYSGWLDHHPGQDEFYVVMFEASGTDGWQALQNIAVTWDCLVVSEHSHNVAAVLNLTLPNDSRSEAEWASTFRIER